MAWDADVAVVGLGAWGASALWQLASRDVDVIGFERFEPGHAQGSSHGGSRMFRITCLEHPGLVPLARRSLELWQQLQSESGRELFFPVGGLLVGPEKGVITGGTLRAAQAHGVEVQTLAPGELNSRFPRHASVPEHHIAVWEPSAGVVRPEESIRAATALAVSAGARVFADTRILAVEPVGGGVVLRTAQRDVRVRQVVVTVGSWLSKLYGSLPLKTVRMPITWFRPVEDDPAFDLEHFPVFMRETDEGPVLWGNGREGGYDVKLGLEGLGRAATQLDPDGDRSVLPEDWTDLGRMLPEMVPGLEELPARVGVCMFTQTPDGQFLLGRPGGDPRVVVAGGCNAHGFKHASGIGEVLADMVQGRDPHVRLAFLSPDRFG